MIAWRGSSGSHPEIASRESSETRVVRSSLMRVERTGGPSYPGATSSRSDGGAAIRAICAQVVRIAFPGLIGRGLLRLGAITDGPGDLSLNINNDLGIDRVAAHDRVVSKVLDALG